MFTFKKYERLCSKKQIDTLFATGRGFFVYPLRVIYLLRDDEAPARILVNVPKKRFKHASDRNLVKRRIREAYRHNKPNLPCDIAFLYASDKKLPYNQIEKAIKKSMANILNLTATNPSNGQ